MRLYSKLVFAHTRTKKMGENHDDRWYADVRGIFISMVISRGGGGGGKSFYSLIQNAPRS